MMFRSACSSSLISPESVSLATPSDGPTDFESNIGEFEEVLGGESEEDDVLSDSSKKECDEAYIDEDQREGNENCEETVEKPTVGMKFDSSDEACLHYARYAKQNGFAMSRRSSKKRANGDIYHITLQCSRGGKARARCDQIMRRPQTKIDCPARCIVALFPDGKWRLNRVILEHNHDFHSPGKLRFHKSYRVLDERAKRKLVLNDKAGIKMNQSYASLQIEAGGPENLPYLQKDCRNYLEKHRRLKLMEGDAEAMQSYFMKMQADNSDFFYAMDFDGEGRVRNVFWADARSRAACKEFGDVVTFDPTYLVNRYDMPFAPFVGVNHHGQSILLGCGLISHEDTDTFSWLFKTWLTCMWNCAPEAIITDQCMAMKNAIQNVFPHTRHRWCIWHILKKVPEKLGKYEAYKSISYHLHNAVFDSLTIEAFEVVWDGFIKKYELQNNEWLHGLYLERKRWVPAFVKDVFWAGMSSTQRSESINHFFDGYINSKTTLKQFVEQYENALKKRVEDEKHEDMKSSSSYIPCILEEEVEKQFQMAYTNAKVKEFRNEFLGKLKCSLFERKVGDTCVELEVQELITYGEEKRRKRMSFIVNFNVESNEAKCNCRLFEFRGMVCRHQLMVFHQRGIERLLDKYVLRRWSKNVKRVHTKVRISYDSSPRSVEAIRHDDICNLADKVADLAENSQDKYAKVMAHLNKLKEELIQSSTVNGSDSVPGTPNSSFPIENEVLHSKESTSILDPLPLRRKGRPPTKRKQGLLEKVVKKKRETQKRTLTKEKEKGVGAQESLGLHKSLFQEVGTQESIANVNGYPSSMGQPMWPSMPYNMAQGGSVHLFSQSNMPSFVNGQVLHQTSVIGSQGWGRGQSSFLEQQSLGWGRQPSLMEGQGLGWGGPEQSFVEMMTARDNGQFGMGQASLPDRQVVGGEESSRRSQVWGVGQPSHVWGGGQPSQAWGGGQPSQAWGGGQPSFTDMMNETDSGEK